MYIIVHLYETAWTFCFSCPAAQRGGAEERESPAGGRVCHRSR